MRWQPITYVFFMKKKKKIWTIFTLISLFSRDLQGKTFFFHLTWKWGTIWLLCVFSGENKTSQCWVNLHFWNAPQVNNINPYIPLLSLYSRNSMAWTSLGPWRFVRNMGSSSHWGWIMVQGQEAIGDNLAKSLLHNNGMLSILIRIALMMRFLWVLTTYNFMIKIRKFPKTLAFWSYQNNFVGTPKRVRSSDGKQAISVRDIEVLLYILWDKHGVHTPFTC